MSLFGTALATFYPRRSIGPFDAYLTIKETTTDRLTITKHPVQRGANVNDHSYIEPAMVVAEVIFDQFLIPLDQTYRKIIQLQRGRIPFQVKTGKRTLPLMLLSSITQTSDEANENVLRLQLVMSEVMLVGDAAPSTASNPSDDVADAMQKMSDRGMRQKIGVPDAKSIILAILEALEGGEAFGL